MGILDGALADKVYQAFRGKLKSGYLRKMEIGSSTAHDSYNDPVDKAPAIYACQGFADNYSDYFRSQAGIPETDVKLCIFGKSLPNGVRPEKDDKAQMGGVWYQVRRAAIDPAGALWECQSFIIEAPVP